MILVAVRLDIGISLQWKLVTFNWGNVLRIGGGPTPNHPLSRGPGSRKGPPGGVYISNNFQKIIRRIWVLERIPIKSYWNAILKRYKSTSEIGNFSFWIRNVDCILSFNGTVSSLKRYQILVIIVIKSKNLALASILIWKDFNRSFGHLKGKSGIFETGAFLSASSAWLENERERAQFQCHQNAYFMD